MKRNGFSLLDTMVAVSGSVVLFLIAIGLIHQSFRLSSIAGKRNEAQSAHARFARIFRDDVHQCVNAEVDASGSLIVSFATSQRVVYRFEKQPKCTLIRLSKAAENENEQREMFFLPPSTIVEFGVDAGTQQAQLKVDSIAPDDPTIRRTETRVVAAINRMQQLTGSSGGSR